ncbi:hypothetical protein CRM22_003870 [Opisthorchis felineus]|uniref:Uncharacterized protein n=1 Tax=Opisthorchis felineus TaxID=147828 RepID=A0A4S2M482_OPIFE|nr:hypothetical protein CRM22_003870 [Opisthorchis felineus]
MSRLTAICLQLFVIYHFYDAIDSKPTPKPVDYVKCFNRCEPKSGKPLEMLTNKGCVDACSDDIVNSCKQLDEAVCV